MVGTKSNTQTQKLENYRIALSNVVNQAELAKLMNEFGYDAEKIAEGNALWESASLALDEHTKIKQATLAAKTAFLSKLESLNLSYSLQRKKARIVFRKDVDTLKILNLTGRLAKGYIKRIETIKTFYHVVQSDVIIQTKLARLKIENIDIVTGLLAIKALETARSSYLIKLGERQDSTKIKDIAMSELKDWMIEFFLVAKIAMQDKPQLLEALGLTVKS